jgi:hypothetical protein
VRIADGPDQIHLSALIVTLCRVLRTDHGGNRLGVGHEIDFFLDALERQHVRDQIVYVDPFSTKPIVCFDERKM